MHLEGQNDVLLITCR